MRPPELRPCTPDGKPISRQRLNAIVEDAAEAALDDPFAPRAPGETSVPDPYPEESMPPEYWAIITSDVDRGEDHRPYPQREDGSE